MDYFSLLPVELLDEIAYDELTYRGLLVLPRFARSLTIGRRFDFMVKFGHDFHVKQYNDSWYNDGWYNRFTKNRNKHRVNDPAEEYADGTKKWYINGRLHREDGPAIECVDGTKDWWVNGKRHREDGPAIERANGSKFWYINGKLHRVDGPAVECEGGQRKWFLNGEEYTEKEFNNIIVNM